MLPAAHKLVGRGVVQLVRAAATGTPGLALTLPPPPRQQLRACCGGLISGVLAWPSIAFAAALLGDERGRALAP